MRYSRRSRRYEPIGLSHVGTLLAEAIGDEKRVRQALGVWPAWEDAVGPQIARRARPASLANGVLTVHVEHSTWMQELVTLRASLLRRVHKFLPVTVVRELRFRVATLPAGPSDDPRAAPVVMAPRAPIPYELARTIRESAPPALRGVLLRVAARWASHPNNAR